MTGSSRQLALNPIDQRPPSGHFPAGGTDLEQIRHPQAGSHRIAVQRTVPQGDGQGYVQAAQKMLQVGLRRCIRLHAIGYDADRKRCGAELRPRHERGDEPPAGPNVDGGRQHRHQDQISHGGQISGFLLGAAVLPVDDDAIKGWPAPAGQFHWRRIRGPLPGPVGARALAVVVNQPHGHAPHRVGGAKVGGHRGLAAAALGVDDQYSVAMPRSWRFDRLRFQVSPPHLTAEFLSRRLNIAPLGRFCLFGSPANGKAHAEQFALMKRPKPAKIAPLWFVDLRLMHGRFGH